MVAIANIYTFSSLPPFQFGTGQPYQPFSPSYGNVFYGFGFPFVPQPPPPSHPPPPPPPGSQPLPQPQSYASVLQYSRYAFDPRFSITPYYYPLMVQPTASGFNSHLPQPLAFPAQLQSSYPPLPQLPPATTLQHAFPSRAPVLAFPNQRPDRVAAPIAPRHLSAETYENPLKRKAKDERELPQENKLAKKQTARERILAALKAVKESKLPQKQGLSKGQKRRAKKAARKALTEAKGAAAEKQSQTSISNTSSTPILMIGPVHPERVAVIKSELDGASPETPNMLSGNRIPPIAKNTYHRENRSFWHEEDSMYAGVKTQKKTGSNMVPLGAPNRLENATSAHALPNGQLHNAVLNQNSFVDKKPSFGVVIPQQISNILKGTANFKENLQMPAERSRDFTPFKRAKMRLVEKTVDIKEAVMNAAKSPFAVSRTSGEYPVKAIEPVTARATVLGLDYLGSSDGEEEGEIVEPPGTIPLRELEDFFTATSHRQAVNKCMASEGQALQDFLAATSKFSKPKTLQSLPEETASLHSVLVRNKEPLYKPTSSYIDTQSPVHEQPRSSSPPIKVEPQEKHTLDYFPQYWLAVETDMGSQVTLAGTQSKNNNSGVRITAETSSCASDKPGLTAEEGSTLVQNARIQKVLSRTEDSREAVFEKAAGSNEKIACDTCITAESETAPMPAERSQVLAFVEDRAPLNYPSNKSPSLGQNGSPLAQAKQVPDVAKSSRVPSLLSEASCERPADARTPISTSNPENNLHAQNSEVDEVSIVQVAEKKPSPPIKKEPLPPLADGLRRPTPKEIQQLQTSIEEAQWEARMAASYEFPAYPTECFPPYVETI